MILQVLRETPDNSGNFVLTGQTLAVIGDVAIATVADLSAGGGRYGLYPYDPIRRDPPAPAPDAAPEPAPPGQ